MDALVVTKPAAAARRCRVDGGEQVVVITPSAAIGFCPSCLCQWAFLGFRQIVKAARFIGGNSDIYDVTAFLNRFKRWHFNITITPPTRHAKRPPINHSGSALCLDSIKSFFVCSFSPCVLHLNAPSPFDDLIGFRLKLHHRREICGDGIGGPNLGMDGSDQEANQVVLWHQGKPSCLFRSSSSGCVQAFSSSGGRRSGGAGRGIQYRMSKAISNSEQLTLYRCHFPRLLM